jgi:predicted PurR-regulated permease PerM
MRELYLKNKLFFLVLLVAAVGFLTWYFLNIVIFIIVAAVIAIIGTPLVDLLDRIRIWKFKFPHFLSVTLTLMLILALFLGMFALFIPLVIKEAQLIRTIDGTQLMAHYDQEMRHLQYMINQYGLMPKGMTLEKSMKEAILKFIDFDFFSNVLTSLISFTGTFFFNLFSVAFLSFFFLMDPAMLPRAILLFTPKAYEEQVINVMFKSRALLSRYFIGLILQIAANIITYSLALYLVGVPNPLVIGFFTGVIIIIPYIGGIISMIMGLLIGLTGIVALGDYSLLMPMALKIIIAMFIVQTIDNNIFAPFIQGKSVKAHPVEVFIVVIAAASLGGIIGMVVAVPAYGFLKIVVHEIREHIKPSKSVTGDA